MSKYEPKDYQITEENIQCAWGVAILLMLIVFFLL